MSGSEIAVVLVLLAVALGILTLRWAIRRALRWVSRRVKRLSRAIGRVLLRIFRRSRPAAAISFSPHVIARVRVVDGDTIDDRKTRIRYRVANIDAPETQDRAKCHRERLQGNIARSAAVGIFRQADSVTAKPTGRFDTYGRVVALIEVDGQDFGEIMVLRGFARRWTGAREKWCGPHGGLACMARVRSHQWSCQTCQNWR